MTKQRLVAPSRDKRSQSAGKASNLDVRHDRTFKRLSALVPKEQWKEVLGYFPENAKAAKLLMLLSDPVNNRLTLGKLSVMSGLSTAELTLFLNNSRKQEGIVRMSQKLPDIMEETAEDALSSFVGCERCGGEGQVKDKPCKSCRGAGVVKVKGDMENRKLVFETMGLAGRRAPGQAIQINVGGSQSLETRVGLAQQLLAEPSVEGEVVSAEDE
ncbi:hypothetical protein LCGC14_2136860 [marine sediment metagenome]|uniref:Uncharacterized protein n=1 Tax=marine sediment metagenome TaxID=412755 RepID=A0A0F9ELZ5_9ZZZZ